MGGGEGEALARHGSFALTAGLVLTYWAAFFSVEKLPQRQLEDIAHFDSSIDGVVTGQLVQIDRDAGTEEYPPFWGRSLLSQFSLPVLTEIYKSTSLPSRAKKALDRRFVD